MITKQFGLVILLLSSSLFANNNIITTLKQFIPEITKKNIQPSVLPGMETVVIGMDIFYVSSDGRYLIQGDLIDLTSGKNFSADKRKITAKTLLNNINDEEKVTFKAANENYIIDVFTDIDCGYCRKLHSEINAFNQLGISVNYLAFPRAGIPSHSYDKAVAVWCSSNPQQAMTDAKNGQEITMNTCPNPVKKELNLAAQLRISGTPSIFLADGTNIPGYLSADELLARITQEAKQETP